MGSAAQSRAGAASQNRWDYPLSVSDTGSPHGYASSMLSRQEHLAEIQRMVDAARSRVERQRQLIAELEANGQDTVVAQHLLLAFERCQALFERDLAAVSQAKDGEAT
jgi:hypothetical protein